MLSCELSMLVKENPNRKKKLRTRIHLPRLFLAKILVSFDFETSSKPSSQLPTVDVILEECKQLLDLQVVSRRTLSVWCRKLGYCYTCSNARSAIVKCKCINDLMLMMCLSSAILLKVRLQRKCFL